MNPDNWKRDDQGLDRCVQCGESPEENLLSFVDEMKKQNPSIMNAFLTQEMVAIALDTHELTHMAAYGYSTRTS